MGYKFKLGDTGKTRGGYSYKIVSADPLVSVIEKSKYVQYAVLYRYGLNFYEYTKSDEDLIPPVRTVYVNFYSGGYATYFCTKELAHLQSRDLVEGERNSMSEEPIAVAVPVEITQS